MAQVFHRSANYIAKASIVGGLLLVLVILGSMSGFFYSSYATGVGDAVEQPVQFSHWHHVGGEGFDCRYCHTSVDKEAFAGMPSTHTCMTCHSQLWKDAPALAPVRESFASGEPLPWNRVHDVSDFAYFNHSIHVNKGVGCSTCHGRVDQMQLVFKNATLYMEWCLECHKNPEPNLRPLSEIYNMNWQPPANQAEAGRRLREEYNIPSKQLLTSCSTCHR